MKDNIVKKEDIIEALIRIGVRDEHVEVHSSLSSFGYVQDGAKAVINALYETVNTAIFPAFFEKAHILPTDYQKYRNNGLFLELINRNSWIGETYTINSPIDKDLGIIPSTVLKEFQFERSNHPTRSWIGIGPHAKEILSGHEHHSLHKPLINLSQLDGFILLLGTNLNTCTAIHLAEELAGRKHFIRWVKMNDQIVDVEEGGDSSGFENLRSYLKDIERRERVGNATLLSYPLNPFLEIIKNEITKNSEITRCSPTCPVCEDTIIRSSKIAINI